MMSLPHFRWQSSIYEPVQGGTLLGGRMGHSEIRPILYPILSLLPLAVSLPVFQSFFVLLLQFHCVAWCYTNKVSLILFWFCSEFNCPIVLGVICPFTLEVIFEVWDPTQGVLGYPELVFSYFEIKISYFGIFWPPCVGMSIAWCHSSSAGEEGEMVHRGRWKVGVLREGAKH